MSFRTTLALLALLAALGAFYAFVERDLPTTEEAEKQSKLLVPRFDPTEWLRVSIAHPRAATAAAIVLARAGPRERWRLEAPLATEADQGEADGILTTLQYLERRGAAKDADPKAVGLEPPRVRLELSAGEARKLVLSFGDDDITGKSAFARVDGRPDVAVIPSSGVPRVDRPLGDLREKRLLSIDRWATGRIEVRSGAAAVAARKENDRWILEADGDLADKGAVEDLLGAAEQARVKEFVADGATPDALATYGLSPARAVLAVATATAAAPQTLEIGGAPPGGKGEVYARRPGTSDVVTIEARVLDLFLGADIERWRSKKLLPHARDAVETVEVRKPGADRPLARLERRLAEPWRFVEPRTATADPQAVDDLVGALQDVEIVALAARKIEDPANFGLGDKTALAIALETPKERLAFRLGKPTVRSDGYYVQREGRDAAFEVVLPKAGALRHAWPVLRDRALVRLETPGVARIDIAHGAAAAVPYVHGKDGWSTPQGTADAASLDRLAGDLGALRAEKILPPPESLEPLGLKTPWLAATVSFAGEKEPPATIKLGKLTPEGDAYSALFQRGEDTLAVTIRKDLVNDLDRLHVAAGGAPPAAPTGTAQPSEPPR